MAKYICFAPSREQRNIFGQPLGMSEERALYYSKNIGKHRIYRNSYPLNEKIFNGKNINEDLKLFYFDNILDAKKLCKQINEIYGDNFLVKEL